MKRILKRSFVFIISLVLVFSISVPCFASDVSPEAFGWNSWTLKEKTDYCCKVGVDILASVTGIVHGDTSSYKEFLLDLYASNPKAGVDNFYEYLATGLSFDDNTQTWELSDDLVQFCNTVIADYNDRVTMTYRYPANPDFVDASCFSSKAVYEEFVRVLNDNPDKFFYYNGSTENGYYLWFYVFEGLESAVYAQPDLPVANCSLYDADWNNSFQAYEICLLNGGSREDGYWQYRPNGYSISSVYQFENIPFSDITFKRTVSQGSLFSAPNLAFDFNYHFVVSAYSGAFNCYKSVDDMKKDLSSQFIGRYTDTYTGTPSQTITQSEVNNVVNNYYGGYPDSGSDGGSDDSSGGSSGGIFDDIIGGIASGVGSIIKGIFSIIKDLVDAIADAIVSIAKSITDLSSLLKTDFTDFLSAVFPFLPQEFITIMIAGLTLCLLGVIIKIFRG